MCHQSPSHGRTRRIWPKDARHARAPQAAKCAMSWISCGARRHPDGRLEPRPALHTHARDAGYTHDVGDGTNTGLAYAIPLAHHSHRDLAINITRLLVPGRLGGARRDLRYCSCWCHTGVRLGPKRAHWPGTTGPTTCMNSGFLGRWGRNRTCNLRFWRSRRAVQSCLKPSNIALNAAFGNASSSGVQERPAGL